MQPRSAVNTRSRVTMFVSVFIAFAFVVLAGLIVAPTSLARFQTSTVVLTGQSTPLPAMDTVAAITIGSTRGSMKGVVSRSEAQHLTRVTLASKVGSNPRGRRHLKSVDRRYTVKSLDTLSGIAASHKTASWHPWATANKDQVKNPDIIFVGQKLRYPTRSHAAPVLKKPVVARHVNARHAAHARRIARKAPPRHASKRHIYRSTSASGGDAKSIARQLLAQRGWSSQWNCLDNLATKESGWNIHAYNAASGATGIPQALPGSKMASAGANWRNSAYVQIKWMLGYISGRYGTPCGAWAHSVAQNWY